MTTATNLHNTFIVFKIVKMLSTPWKDFDAYKLGIIGEKGELLKKPETKEERESYDVLTRMVVNIKRLSQKIPGAQFASYAAALFLIREEYNLSDDDILNICEKIPADLYNLKESTYWFIEDHILSPGRYRLVDNVYIDGVNEARKGTEVIVEEHTAGENFLGEYIYSVKHKNTGLILRISPEDITK